MTRLLVRLEARIPGAGHERLPCCSAWGQLWTENTRTATHKQCFMVADWSSGGNSDLVPQPRLLISQAPANLSGSHQLFIREMMGLGGQDVLGICILMLIKLLQRGRAGSILSKVTEPNVLTRLRGRRREELPGEGLAVHGRARSKAGPLSPLRPSLSFLRLVKYVYSGRFPRKSVESNVIHRMNTDI
ncbi:hypothetical protein MDA_GLEAN10018395 [Myotis davidii]|uniref:Uncharacterized protein n=1 Tax=Myotis davidii TaxID=225400 RepID=L5M0J3_MYODS|nr:hypothetical protein MDA_GLEAN10018395 [Myotis davidii]